MLKAFSKFILRLFGWRVIGGLPTGIKKCVVIEAPHTSMWDFVIGRMAFWYFGIKVRFLIKKEMFKPLLSPFLKSMGGIPVDRSRNSGMVNQVAALFEKNDTLYVVITPEGTRKLVPKWKKGFYFIASKAMVPIALGYLDYKLKEGGIGKVMYPTGNFEKDFAEIEDFYREKHPKYPEKFNLSPKKPAQYNGCCRPAQ